MLHMVSRSEPMRTTCLAIDPFSPERCWRLLADPVAADAPSAAQSRKAESAVVVDPTRPVSASWIGEKSDAQSAGVAECEM